MLIQPILFSSVLISSLLLQLCCIGVQSVSFKKDVTITFDQKIAIEKLRKKVRPHIVEDYMKDDIYLVKWLRSTNFDVLLAEKKLIENIKWRQQTQMATIEKVDFSDVANDYPYTKDGFDKEGRPIMIAFVGDWDIRSAIVTGRIKRALLYADKGMEMLSRKIRQLQREGKNVTQSILIVDLSQSSVVTHACVQCLVKMVEFLNSYENHFPGMCDKVIFLNTQPAVYFVVEIIRRNVSKETRNAMHVYGTNEEHWKKVLLEYIDKKYLPVELGGTLERN